MSSTVDVMVGIDVDRHLANLLSYLSRQHLFQVAQLERSLGVPGLEKDLAIVLLGQDLKRLTWRGFTSLWRKRLRLRIQEERGWQCDQCGRGGGLDMHEAFVPRSAVKGWRQFFLFCEENIVLLCRSCHSCPDKDRLLELQRARGHEIGDDFLWPGAQEILKSFRGLGGRGDDTG